MKNQKIMFTSVLLALACFAVSSTALAVPRPTPTPTPTATPPLGEDRGNGNSAAENVDALNLSTTGSNNTAHGWYSLYSNTTGTYNIADGVYALYSNTTGTFNTAIGVGADVGFGDLTNATAIGHGAVVDASNKVRIGNSSVTVIEGQVAYTFSSDRNKKENFQSANGEEVLQKIRQLNLTSWNYIGQDAKTLRHYGPMAQDFYAAFGHDAIGTVGTPTAINSGDMAGIMMIAIKTLATEVANQEAVNAEQRKRLEALTARFEEQDAQIQKVSAQLQMRQPRMSLARINP